MNFNHFKNSNSALRDEQMKDIKGGGTCGFVTPSGTEVCGVSKQVALRMVQDGGHWCCDSCITSPRFQCY
jgi:natural product precursor